MRISLTDIAMTYSVQAGPAPDLTEMGVYKVASMNAGIEDVYQKISTQLDHGGDALYIFTYEFGYSSNYSRIAMINGARLKEINSEPILNSLNTVIGWKRLWDASGHQGGYFTYKADSLNHSGKSMSTSINIQ